MPTQYPYRESLFVVFLKDVPIQRVSPLFYTDYDNPYTVTHMNLYLSPTGRFATFKGAAYFNDQQLLSLFIQHHLPIIEAKGYSDCTLVSESFYPSRWDYKRMEKHLSVLKASLQC